MAIAGIIQVLLTANAKGVVAGTSKAKAALLGMNQAVNSVAMSFAKIGIAAGAVVVPVVKMAADMEKGLTEIGTLVGGLTDGEFADMRKELESLAVSGAQSIDKLVKAKYDIISAGFTNAADSAILLEQSSRLASAGVSDVATTADVLTTALNAYNLTAEDASLINDVLFTTVKQGKTTIDALAQSLGNAIPVAAELGIPIQDVGAAVAALTAAGQSTDIAVTNLKSAMVQLLKPSQDGAAAIRKVGFESGRALINAKGFQGALQTLKKAAEDGTIKLTDVFQNVRAMQAAFPLTGTAADRFADNIRGMSNAAGAADEAFRQMAETTSFKLKQAFEKFKNVARDVGFDLLPAVGRAAEFVTENMGPLIAAFGALAVAIAAVKIALFLASITPLGLAITGISLAIAGVVFAIKKWPEVFTGIANGVKATMQNIGTFIVAAFLGAKEIVSAFGTFFKNIFGSIKEIVKSFFSIFTEGFGAGIENMKNAIMNFGVGATEAFGNASIAAQEYLDKSLVPVSFAAVKMGEDFQEAGDKAGKSIDETKKSVDDLRKATVAASNDATTMGARFRAALRRSAVDFDTAEEGARLLGNTVETSVVNSLELVALEGKNATKALKELFSLKNLALQFGKEIIRFGVRAGLAIVTGGASELVPAGTEGSNFNLTGFSGPVQGRGQKDVVGLGSPGGITIEMNVAAMDARTFEDWVKGDGRQGIVEALQDIDQRGP